jgi:hypothetical protein
MAAVPSSCKAANNTATQQFLGDEHGGTPVRFVIQGCSTFVNNRRCYVFNLSRNTFFIFSSLGWMMIWQCGCLG